MDLTQQQPNATAAAASHDYERVPIGKVVAELRSTYPDITHSSLRFLEQEGLVEPLRTPGGHRLYSAVDIARIRQIKAWQAQRLSLEQIRDRLRAQRELESFGRLAADFLAAALAGDPAARRMVLHADDIGLPLMQIFQDVLSAALQELGRRWVAGELRVGQEHEVSEIVRELIAELGLRHAHPRPSGRPILAASVSGEHHDLGLRMLVALLRAEGRIVPFLGADVATRFLVEETELRQPAAVILSATRVERLPALAEAGVALRLAAAGTPIVVGGQVVAEYADELRKWGLVPVPPVDLPEAMERIRGIYQQAVTSPGDPSVSDNRIVAGQIPVEEWEVASERE